eukprot:GHVT01063564.1.p1 GENE.GHVT01063564.1~~GHVT01063564.1.p1  ORF type:complete len:744 (+),score=55.64 GHVT01063564.1:1169-3400(+)
MCISLRLIEIREAAGKCGHEPQCSGQLDRLRMNIRHVQRLVDEKLFRARDAFGRMLMFQNTFKKTQLNAEDMRHSLAHLSMKRENVLVANIRQGLSTAKQILDTLERQTVSPPLDSEKLLADVEAQQPHDDSAEFKADDAHYLEQHLENSASSLGSSLETQLKTLEESLDTAYRLLDVSTKLPTSHDSTFGSPNPAAHGQPASNQRRVRLDDLRQELEHIRQRADSTLLEVKPCLVEPCRHPEKESPSSTDSIISQALQAVESLETATGEIAAAWRIASGLKANIDEKLRHLSKDLYAHLQTDSNNSALTSSVQPDISPAVNETVVTSAPTAQEIIETLTHLRADRDRCNLLYSITTKILTRKVLPSRSRVDAAVKRLQEHGGAVVDGLVNSIQRRQIHTLIQANENRSRLAQANGWSEQITLKPLNLEALWRNIAWLEQAVDAAEQEVTSLSGIEVPPHKQPSSLQAKKEAPETIAPVETKEQEKIDKPHIEPFLTTLAPATEPTKTLRGQNSRPPAEQQPGQSQRRLAVGKFERGQQARHYLNSVLPVIDQVLIQHKDMVQYSLPLRQCESLAQSDGNWEGALSEIQLRTRKMEGRIAKLRSLAGRRWCDILKETAAQSGIQIDNAMGAGSMALALDSEHSSENISVISLVVCLACALFLLAILIFLSTALWLRYHKRKLVKLAGVYMLTVSEADRLEKDFCVSHHSPENGAEGVMVSGAALPLSFSWFMKMCRCCSVPSK